MRPLPKAGGICAVAPHPHVSTCPAPCPRPDCSRPCAQTALPPPCQAQVRQTFLDADDDGSGRLAPDEFVRAFLGALAGQRGGQRRRRSSRRRELFDGLCRHFRCPTRVLPLLTQALTPASCGWVGGCCIHSQFTLWTVSSTSSTCTGTTRALSIAAGLDPARFHAFAPQNRHLADGGRR